MCRKQIPKDVWQLRAPVDELVPVGQGGGKRNKLNLVTTEALGLGGREVQLWEEGDESGVLWSGFCFCSTWFTFLPRWKGTTLSSSACRINRGQEMWFTLARTNSNTATLNKRHFLIRPVGGGAELQLSGRVRSGTAVKFGMNYLQDFVLTLHPSLEAANCNSVAPRVL